MKKECLQRKIYSEQSDSQTPDNQLRCAEFSARRSVVFEENFKSYIISRNTFERSMQQGFSTSDSITDSAV